MLLRREICEHFKVRVKNVSIGTVAIELNKI